MHGCSHFGPCVSCLCRFAILFSAIGDNFANKLLQDNSALFVSRIGDNFANNLLKDNSAPILFPDLDIIFANKT